MPKKAVRVRKPLTEVAGPNQLASKPKNPSKPTSTSTVSRSATKEASRKRPREDEDKENVRIRHNLATKVAFIKEAQEALKRDSKASIAAIGRKPEYGFTKQMCSYNMQRASEYLQQAQDAGENAKKISNISIRNMRAVESVAMLLFKDEVGHSKFKWT